MTFTQTLYFSPTYRVPPQRSSRWLPPPDTLLPSKASAMPLRHIGEATLIQLIHLSHQRFLLLHQIAGLPFRRHQVSEV